MDVELIAAPTSASHVLTIWYKPRSTIRKVVETNPNYLVYPLAALSGVYHYLDQAAERGLGDRISLLSIIIIALVIGSLWGIITLKISGVLFRWTGSWLGGKATSREVRAAYAWSSLPDTVLLVSFLPLIAIFGRNWFMRSTEWTDPLVIFLIVGYGFCIGLPLLVWRIFLFVKCLSEVHQFSAWKGLLASFLGVLVIVIPIILVVLALR